MDGLFLVRETEDKKMSDLFDMLNQLAVNSMYSLFVYNPAGLYYYDECCSENLGDILDHTLKVKGVWKIYNGNDELVLFGRN